MEHVGPADAAGEERRELLGALAREQTLRALAAPEAPSASETGAEPGQGVEQARTDAPGPQETPRRRWWQRWQRGKEKA